MSYHPNTLPLGRAHNAFTIFGRKFPYKQGDKQDERRAEHDAQIFGAAQKQRREDLCGRPLSAKELLYDSVYHSDGRTLREKLNSQSTTVFTNEKLEGNPHLYRLEQLRATVVNTKQQAAQRQRRIDQCQREADAWEAGHLPKVETNDPNAVNSAVNHASITQRAILDSLDTTQADVEGAAERLRIAASEPERYRAEFDTWKAEFDERMAAKRAEILAPVVDLAAAANKVGVFLPDAPTTTTSEVTT